MLMNIVNLWIQQMLGGNVSPEATPGFWAHLSKVNLRRWMMLVSGLVVSLVIFLGGFFTVLTDLVLSSRQDHQLMLSPASIIGFALIGMSVLCFWALFSRKVWKVSTPLHQNETLTPSPVSEAVAELIRDFVEERRLGREMAVAQMAEQMAAQAAAASAAAQGVSPVSETMTGSQSQPVFN